MTANWKQWDGLAVDGKYRLIQYLGGSGHSAVYLTETSGPETKRAAIKFLRADPTRAEQQLSRWRMAARLSHPGLQPILDAGRCQIEGEDLLYVLMELAEENLSQILPQRCLSADETKEMLRQVLDALNFLHEKKLVHTRIKPSNICAVDDKIQISADQICAAGEILMPLEAKNLYAAPEDVGGVAVPSSDVWSLGVTIVEVLTQHHPSWQQTPTGELKLAEELPSPFQEIASHALVRETTRRWNVKDMKADLDAPRRKPLEEWRWAEELTSREPKEPVKKRSESIPRKAQMQDDTRRRGLPFSPMWIIGPGIVGGALLVAWISLSRSVPHRPAEEPAASSPAAEANAQPATKDVIVTKEDSGKSSRAPKRVERASAAVKDSAERSRQPSNSVVESPQEKKVASDHGQVLDQVMPDTSEKARDTIRGTVRVSVRVQVDASGKVTQAEFESRGPSAYFANKALEAAKKWEFITPESEGRSAPSEWILHFEFRPSGTKAYAKQAAP